MSVMVIGYVSVAVIYSSFFLMNKKALLLKNTTEHEIHHHSSAGDHHHSHKNEKCQGISDPLRMWTYNNEGQSLHCRLDEKKEILRKIQEKKIEIKEKLR